MQVRGDALCFYARPHADLCQADWQALDNAIYGELCEARLAFCVRNGAGRAFGAWQASLPMHAAACGAPAEDARGKAAATGHLRPPPPPPRSSSSRAAGPRLQTCARWLRTFGQASAACSRRTLRPQDCGGGLRSGAGLEALELVLLKPGTSGLMASPHAEPVLPASTRAPAPPGRFDYSRRRGGEEGEDVNKAGAAGMAELQAFSSTVFGGRTLTGQRGQPSPAFVMPPALPSHGLAPAARRMTLGKTCRVPWRSPEHIMRH